MGDIFGAPGELLASTIRFATPLIFAALGGMFSERGGVVNIGLEGLMLISAFAGVVGASLSGNAFVGLGFALAAGLAFALIHALMCVTFEADQIISGTAINLLALGGTGFLLVEIFGTGGTSPRVEGFEELPLPLLSDIPVVGPALMQAMMAGATDEQLAAASENENMLKMVESMPMGQFARFPGVEIPDAALEQLMELSASAG